jgi:hypothetical protein
MKLRSDDIEVIYIDTPITEESIKKAYGQKKSLYGITQDQYMAIAEAQGFACASCGDSAKGVEHTLCVDHDHYTNEIRGLLCSGCNTALGWLEDDIERVNKLAKYIQSKGTGVFIPATGLSAK